MKPIIKHIGSVAIEFIFDFKFLVDPTNDVGHISATNTQNKQKEPTKQNILD